MCKTHGDGAGVLATGGKTKAGRDGARMGIRGVGISNMMCQDTAIGEQYDILAA